MKRDTGDAFATFVTHLECSATGERHDAGALQGLSRAGAPLLARYDLDRLARAVTKETVAGRPADLWRYREFLPVRRAADIVSLGEAMTPLVPLARMRQKLGGGEILVKDEGRLPTGSFKARGFAVAVSMAKSFGVRRLAMPTAGNAGAAGAAYGARAGMETYIFTPDDTPEVTAREIGFHGARVYRVNGFINHCGEVVAAGTATMGWFDFATLKEPYRMEGKKTMGLELAEQLGWDVPDVILYPTGGGTGLIGMWKAFRELQAIGWLGSRLPRMVAVQSTGCGPIPKAFAAGLDHVPEPWAPVTTTIPGVRVPKPIGDKLILKTVYESNGFAIAVDDDEAHAARAEIAKEEGLHLCPEGAATFVAHRTALKDGRIGKNDRVVLFNCASGLKYPMPPVDKRLDRTRLIDFTKL